MAELRRLIERQSRIPKSAAKREWRSGRAYFRLFTVAALRSHPATKCHMVVRGELKSPVFGHNLVQLKNGIAFAVDARCS